ncbi:hypothetical protein E4U21_006669 [Claviceps maximensis]|nr:hypothetical protein E4U21_006669 [Claviceps maximensis]
MKYITLLSSLALAALQARALDLTVFDPEEKSGIAKRDDASCCIGFHNDHLDKDISFAKGVAPILLHAVDGCDGTLLRDPNNCDKWSVTFSAGCEGVIQVQDVTVQSADKCKGAA